MITTGIQPTSRKRNLLLTGRVPSAVAPIHGVGRARDGVMLGRQAVIEPSPVRGSAP